MMPRKRKSEIRIEDEKRLEEVLKTPMAPFDTQDLSVRQILVYQNMLRGLSPAEIAIELGTTEASVRESLDAASERFLRELDDLRITRKAVNIARIEWVIARLMKHIGDGIPDRDAVANLLKAIKLESDMLKEDAPPPLPQNGGSTYIFTPTLSTRSKLYEEAIPQMNPEAVQHYHPEVYERHKDIIKDPRVKRLENLVPESVEIDEDR